MAFIKFIVNSVLKLKTNAVLLFVNYTLVLYEIRFLYISDLSAWRSGLTLYSWKEWIGISVIPMEPTRSPIIPKGLNLPNDKQETIFW